MKLKNLVNSPAPKPGRVIARFGRATLLRQSNGQYRLTGGSPGDHTEAREWISLFLHEAVVTTSSDPGEVPPFRAAA